MSMNSCAFLLVISSFFFLLRSDAPRRLLHFLGQSANLTKSTPWSHFVAAIVVLLGCLPVMCVALIPFVPYGTTGTSDAALDQYARSRLYGPYSLPSPMVFTDGGRETQYFVSTNGAIMFQQYSDLYRTNVRSGKRSIDCGSVRSFRSFLVPKTGMYHRTFSGNESLMRSTWSGCADKYSVYPNICSCCDNGSNGQTRRWETR
ncbi:membrane-associated protein, putative [Bodo saltans]|uniref:Membrane-associated protein, putative n=1 Tax=Bodo saltans TaxID=75058 RepID=A0A0S4J3H5_BODSA|nr:membrane-associated protein, putative [Bodo saltans]|eukprot:CUG77616.1 membrane-associated protein, putative [Bodo saltans]